MGLWSRSGVPRSSSPLRRSCWRQRPRHRRSPIGAELQWDWVELPGALRGSADARLLVGGLPYSDKFRGVFALVEDQAHLVAAMDAVLAQLGGAGGEVGDHDVDTSGHKALDVVPAVRRPSHHPEPDLMAHGHLL